MLYWWSGLSEHWPSLLRYAMIVSLTCVACFILIRLGTLPKKFRIGTYLRYPPIWFSSLFIVILLLALTIRGDKTGAFLSVNNQYSELFISLFMACVGVFLAFVYDYLEALRSSPATVLSGRNRSLPRLHNIIDNESDLITWILDESPIRDPSDDLFGHAVPARRVARLLLQEAPSSIGIVGPYGSGKSSLINLVEYYLSHTSDLGQQGDGPLYSGRTIRCKIDGWGRVSGTVAQKILALAIEQVKHHVDCTSIISLPESYLRAIAGTKSAGGAVLSALLQTPHDPVAQLSKLDNILAAAKLRLIIFLEDLDRNVGVEIIREEMPSLLDRLRTLGQVSFVLAIGTEQKLSNVLIRICDHVEAIS